MRLFLGSNNGWESVGCVTRPWCEVATARPGPAGCSDHKHAARRLSVLAQHCASSSGQGLGGSCTCTTSCRSRGRHLAKKIARESRRILYLRAASEPSALLLIYTILPRRATGGYLGNSDLCQYFCHLGAKSEGRSESGSEDGSIGFPSDLEAMYRKREGFNQEDSTFFNPASCRPRWIYQFAPRLRWVGI